MGKTDEERYCFLFCFKSYQSQVLPNKNLLSLENTPIILIPVLCLETAFELSGLARRWGSWGHVLPPKISNLKCPSWKIEMKKSEGHCSALLIQRSLQVGFLCHSSHHVNAFPPHVCSHCPTFASQIYNRNIIRFCIPDCFLRLFIKSSTSCLYSCEDEYARISVTLKELLCSFSIIILSDMGQIPIKDLAMSLKIAMPKPWTSSSPPEYTSIMTWLSTLPLIHSAVFTLEKIA